MNPRVSDCALIAFALAALSVVGGMDLQDAQAVEPVTPVAPLDCRDKLNLRVALTADEAAGRCDLTKGTKK